MTLSFPQRVRALVDAIPHGKVLNYGQVARLLGQPYAARAVGYALSNLPAGGNTPWHRVVGKSGLSGKVTIKHAAAEQIARLAAEGVPIDAEGLFPLALYLWQPDPIEVAAILAAAE